MSEQLVRSGEELFKPARKGYDRVEVDAHVAQLHRQIRELQQLQQTPDAARSHAIERVGDEVSAILKQAHATADEIIAAGQREADDHREQAARHAAHVTAVAEQRVHELDLDTDRIWAERERIVGDARDLSRQLNAVADTAAQRFPDDPAAPQGATAEGGYGFGGDRAAGFDELNAGN
jgi:cell division septum initiation protein DivIVA